MLIALTAAWVCCAVAMACGVALVVWVRRLIRDLDALTAAAADLASENAGLRARLNGKYASLPCPPPPHRLQ